MSIFEGMHILTFGAHPDVGQLLVPNDGFDFVKTYDKADGTAHVQYETPDGEANWYWSDHFGSWDGTFITNSGLVASAADPVQTPWQPAGHFSTEFVWSMHTNQYVNDTPAQLSPHDAFLFV